MTCVGVYWKCIGHEARQTLVFWHNLMAYEMDYVLREYWTYLNEHTYRKMV